MKEHPGGAQSIISAAGLDSSDEFMAIHSETAKGMMPTYHIGTLDAAAKLSLCEPQSEVVSNEPRETFLQPRAWTKAVLQEKKRISADTIIFTFTLEHESQTLGLPVGQHLMIRLRDPVEREAIIRPYTPISEITRKGHLDVLIKLYLDEDNPRGQLKGGKMSKAMNALPIGHGVDFKGPIGKFTYLGKGLCAINGNERKVKRFAMICGGSGITPIFQVFRAVMRDKDDPTICTVLNGNRLVEDILCKEDLDSLLKGNEDKGEIIHTLTQAPENWQGLRGRINAALVDKHCECHAETMVLICGPEALEKSIHVALKVQGWNDDQILFF